MAPSDADIERIIDLMDDAKNMILSDSQAAYAAVANGETSAIRQIEGHFAIVAKKEHTVRMARSLGRPMRYFLAQRQTGPCLVVAERIEQIRDALHAEGLVDQFHPSSTRMVPAHHLVELRLTGCSEPTPILTRFFTPERNQLPADLDVIGLAYVRALQAVCDRWLRRIERDEPIGLLFSGGIDSGALLILLNRLLREYGQSPSRLKAFTLSVDNEGSDTIQAANFCRDVGLSMHLEVIECTRSQVDWRKAIRVVEDYKPLDIQAATFCLAACEGIRKRYPDWRYLVDGDGGDENLKDYPIEDNPKLTIRSVLNNRMLYQEGWGVDAVKHSRVYSGGQSRGHVRSYAPAAMNAFVGFSPYAVPDVIEVAEGIPFVELTQWDHHKLYRLKGEVMRRGIRALTGVEMPIFEKRRFQHGAVSETNFSRLFPTEEPAYRRAYAELFSAT